MESNSEQQKATASLSIATIACCSVAIATLIPILLYQLKAIKNLPDPPGDLFDSEYITTSKEAFPFGVPDGALGIASYSTTMALLLTDKPERPILHRALQLKLVLDAGMAATNTIRQLVRFKRVCSWCMGTVLSTGGMLYCWQHSRKARW